MIRLGRELLAMDPAARTDQLPRWLKASVRDDDVERAGDAVSISTFHAAKGLEWSIVHLAGAEDGYVPISRARETEAIEEERRLLYVAVTRAERVLRISWAQTRTFGERTVERRPSPFLRSVETTLGDLDERVARPRRGRRPPGDQPRRAGRVRCRGAPRRRPCRPRRAAGVARRGRPSGQGQPRRGPVRPGVDRRRLGSAHRPAASSATCPASAASGPTTYGDQLVALVREHAAEVNR